MTTEELARLREIAAKARPDDWEDEFWHTFPPATVLALLDEIDRLNSFIVACDRADLAIEIDRLKADEDRLATSYHHLTTKLLARIEELEKEGSTADLMSLLAAHKELREENNRLRQEVEGWKRNADETLASRNLQLSIRKRVETENVTLRSRIEELESNQAR